MNARQFNMAKALYRSLNEAQDQALQHRIPAPFRHEPFESLSPAMQRRLAAAAEAVLEEARKQSPYGEFYL